jgi:hypothetical protein
VSDPRQSGPDWAAIFDRAHRHLGRRLLLLAGIGAAGALLLLSGGLTANGTIEVLQTSSANKEPRRHREPKPHRQGKPSGREQENPPKDRKQHATSAHSGKPAIDSNPKTPKCKAESGGDSAGTEYEDCPRQVPEEGEEEKEKGGEGGESSLSEAASAED